MLKVMPFFKENPNRLALPVSDKLVSMLKIKYWRPGIMCDGVAKHSVRKDGTDFLTCFDSHGKWVTYKEANEYATISMFRLPNGEKEICYSTKDNPEITVITKFPKESQREIISSIRSHTRQVPNSKPQHTSLGMKMGW